MKKALIILGILVVLSSVIFTAPLGLGAKVGDPTGLYIRSYTSSTTFIGITAAWSFTEDYLWLGFDYNSISKGTFGAIDLGYGGGVHIGIGDGLNFGVRFPVSLNYAIPQSPLEFFLEFAPSFNVIPEPKFNLSGGAGMIFKF
ncbi:hypothetical protein PW5551_06820 [Petrotoga sp. 9PW.55.5.1]|uniref:hypothetical protein n=1 Tax=Petrotoga sp. 9PW.55.5.1 TaxID=1308979 RepID=UPI000DC587DB|nr:hypothetical protein [Petrotoga sp. 9PW.55.5.1]RAO98968.1 hypothetical protein PW5551_06820 [Petrotoga sp. 9PW.55.5.1]